MPAQSDILTVTFNPAVDLSTSVAQVIAGPKLRCAAPRFDAGGGGVNVARAVCKLGGTTRALVAVNGPMGDKLLSLLATEGVPSCSVQAGGDTRQSFAVTDVSDNAQYRFSVPGQLMNADDADRLAAAVVAEAPERGCIVFSGSVTPGLPEDFLNTLIAAVAPKSPMLIVDTSSFALERLVSHPVGPVDILRLDQSEAVALAGHVLPTRADNVAFARTLLARRVAKVVIVGRGSAGSLLVSEDLRLFCPAPVAPVRSKIGAGDAFVGSMTLALARGQGLQDALRWGVAAASATVGTEGTALCELDETTRQFAQTRIEPL